jgi:pimeloyl-ACP methyl ester carboxylesterase
VKLPVGGAEAYVYTGGKAFDAGAPTVVFIHGALHDHSVWTLLARWCVNHGHSVLVPDLPGHGRTVAPPLASVEALADWVLALLDAAGVRRAALVGHSMGSLIALETAGRVPERASALVMLGTAYPMTVSPALLETARTNPLAAIDSVNAFSIATLAAKPSYPGPGGWLHGANRQLMRRMQAGQPGLNLFLNDFEVCNSYRHGFEAAAQVRCPTTLVLGERDQMTRPSQTVELAAALKTEPVRLPSGHSLSFEVPELLLGVLAGALPAA